MAHQICNTEAVHAFSALSLVVVSLAVGCDRHARVGCRLHEVCSARGAGAHCGVTLRGTVGDIPVAHIVLESEIGVTVLACA